MGIEILCKLGIQRIVLGRLLIILHKGQGHGAQIHL